MLAVECCLPLLRAIPQRGNRIKITSLSDSNVTENVTSTKVALWSDHPFRIPPWGTVIHSGRKQNSYHRRHVPKRNSTTTTMDYDACLDSITLKKLLVMEEGSIGKHKVEGDHSHACVCPFVCLRSSICYICSECASAGAQESACLICRSYGFDVKLG